MAEEKKNEIAKLGELAPSKYDDSVFDEIAKSGDFLPRLQLMTANSGPVKDGEFSVNHYAMVDNGNLIDLGKEVDVAVIAWRPKALDTSENIGSFEPESELYQQIKEKSKISNSGCMYGPEFLCYIGSRKAFVTFFMGSKSARKTANKVKSFVKKFATLKSVKIDNKKYTWFAPSVTKCSSEFPLPPLDELTDKVDKFNNPQSADVKKADSSDSGDRAR